MGDVASKANTKSESFEKNRGRTTRDIVSLLGISNLVTSPSRGEDASRGEHLGEHLGELFGVADFRDFLGFFGFVSKVENELLFAKRDFCLRFVAFGSGIDKSF
mmetsp:Transcript_29928/g.46005  ORF Transcript_29928/g.46005 Transcript_29928/m.46005 type:complete len:104 (-) Transcript_29928:264-575(-)